MAAKEILFDTHARKHFANGLDILANAVRVTLGPRGRNVVNVEAPRATALNAVRRLANIVPEVSENCFSHPLHLKIRRALNS